ncbi:hypothetical protein [Paradevosia shaoguanensis]|uniref:hypothetical protein n=1 Tax=Paradevosia shaoguanensis TaxID=1335043 RepID=UPI001933E593|nr:hypothetical protein [Paradevosia shaoguanensis]
MFSVPPSRSPSINGLLFPVIHAAGGLPAAEPLPLTLAWHVSAYALDVVAGRRSLTKPMAETYLDEVTFAGRLGAKRPSSAAFVSMVRAHIIDLALPADCDAPRANCSSPWPASCAVDTDCRLEFTASLLSSSVLVDPANDNLRRD